MALWSKIFKKRQKGIIGIVVMIVAIAVTLVAAVTAIAIPAVLGPTGTPGGGTGTGTTIGTTTATPPQGIMERINANLPDYQAAATKGGIPWQMLAAIHYREANADPGHNTLGGEPLGEKAKDSGLRPYTLLESANYSVGFIKSLYKMVYNADFPTNPNDEEIKNAFLSYNRGALYKQHGCTADQSPYVMNGYDESHKNMSWAPSCGDTVSGPDGNLGAYTMYVILIRGQK